MKTSGMTLSGYLSFSWRYMLCVFATGIAMLLIVQSGIMGQVAFNPFGIIGIAATFGAGWSAAKRKLSMAQAAAVGFFCFLGIVWLVPLSVMPFMEQMGVPQEAFALNLAVLCVVNGAINLAIYEAAVLGGFLTGRKLARGGK